MAIIGFSELEKPEVNFFFVICSSYISIDANINATIQLQVIVDGFTLCPNNMQQKPTDLLSLKKKHIDTETKTELWPF